MIPTSVSAGKVGLWLLVVELGGERLLVSTESAVVELNAGGSHSFMEGLSSFDLATDEDEVGITLDVDGMNWAALEAAGTSLDGRPFTLHRWFEGQTWEEAELVLDGRTAAPSYADPSSPTSLRLTLSRDVQGLSLEHPPPQARVDPSTWPVNPSAVLDDGIVGAAYPWIFGYPGNPILPCSPGLLAQVWTNAGTVLLIAGHRVEAATVEVYDTTQTPPRFDVRPVHHMQDGLGRWIAYVDFVGSTLIHTAGTKYLIGWSSDAGWGGGLIGDDGAVLRGLGDILIWGTRSFTGQRYDLGRMEAERAKLNRFKIDAVWNGVMRWDDWVNRNILGLFPVERVQGERGRFYKLVDWTADKSFTVAKLSADGPEIGGIPVERKGPISDTTGDIYNELGLEFGPMNMSSLFRHKTLLSGEQFEITAGTVEDPRILPSTACRISQQRTMYGKRPKTWQTRVLWDKGSANTVLKSLSVKHALRHKLVSYVGPSELLELEQWSWITLQDTQLGASFVDRVALIRRIVRIDQSPLVRVDLLVRNDPSRDLRLAS